MSIWTTVTINGTEEPVDNDRYYVGDYSPRPKGISRPSWEESKNKNNSLGIDLSEAAKINKRMNARINGNWSK